MWNSMSLNDIFANNRSVSSLQSPPSAGTPGSTGLQGSNGLGTSITGALSSSANNLSHSTSIGTNDYLGSSSKLWMDSDNVSGTPSEHGQRSHVRKVSNNAQIWRNDNLTPTHNFHLAGMADFQPFGSSLSLNLPSYSNIYEPSEDDRDKLI